MKADLPGFLLPLAQTLPQFKPTLVLPAEERLLRNGQIGHSLSARLLPLFKQSLAAEQSTFVRAISERGDLIALLEIGRGGPKVRRVFLS